MKLTVAADGQRHRVLEAFVQACCHDILSLQIDGAPQARALLGQLEPVQPQWLMLTTATQACCILQPQADCLSLLGKHQHLWTAWHVPSVLHRLLQLRPQAERHGAWHQLPTRWACASLCHQLLHYNSPEPNLDDLTWIKAYDVDPPAPHRQSLEALADNGRALVVLIDIMGRQLQQHQLQRVSRLEHKALLPIVAMEQVGLACHGPSWLACCAQEQQHLEQVDSKLSSPQRQQLQRRLRQFGADWLRYLRSDGRIHSTLHSIGATTGRMTCTQPNLQALIDCQQRRACFREPQGQCIIMADYSACELRILAQLSREPVLLQGFAAKQDIHRQIADKLFPPTTDPTQRAQQRAQAKQISFGLIYGMGAERLATLCQLSPAQGRALLTRYFAAMPKLAAFLEQAVDRIEQEHKLRTLAGRLLSTGQTDKLDPNRRLRLARNMPIQGTGADLIKLALSAVQQRLQSTPAAKLLHVVHDEIIVSCPPQQAKQVEEAITRGMIEAGQQLLPDVPIAVDRQIAWYWSKHAPAVNLEAWQDLQSSHHPEATRLQGSA